MLGVLSLFLIPVGGGIPAGVLLAKKIGLRWPLTAALYFVSDVILAFAFEPVMLGLAALGRRLPAFARMREAFEAVGLGQLVDFLHGGSAGHQRRPRSRRFSTCAQISAAIASGALAPSIRTQRSDSSLAIAA